MPKRITYLEKHPGLSLNAFFDHWSTAHADIARDLPGLSRYLQNHVEHSAPGLGAEDHYRIDGIVELWFDTDEVVGAATDSTVADRLIEDEKTFLAGLTGGPMRSGEPHPHWPFKVWVIGMASNANVLNVSEGLDPVGAWVRSVSFDLPGLIGSELNVLEDCSQLLRRDALRSEPRMPDLAVAFGFEASHDAVYAVDHLAVAVGSLTGAVEKVHVYCASEKVIV